MKRPSLHFLAAGRFWQRAAFLLAAIGTFVAIAYAIENNRGEKAWRSYRLEAEGRGAKLDWDAFIPPPIPDEENFADLPIYHELLSSDPAVRARFLHGSEFSGEGTVLGRDHREIAPNFSALQKRFANASLIAKPTDDPVADVLRALDRYEPVLGQMRAALARPRSRLDSEWEKGFDAAFWHIGDTLSINQIISLRVSALIASGRAAEAATDWEAGFRHASIFQGEPGLLAGMLRVMLVAGLTNTLWNGFDRHVWNDAELARISENLGEINLMSDFTFAMSSERALLNLVVEEMKANRNVWALRTSSGKQPKWSWVMLIPQGWFEQNRRHLNQWYDRQIADAAWAEEHPPAREPVEPFEVPDSWYRLPYWFIVRLAVSNSDDLLEACRNPQADVDLARVACALERFRLRNGAFPERLDKLTPAFLAAIPRDPYADGPLRSKSAADGGLILYSIGADLRDDGGDREKDMAWHASP